MNYGVPYQGGKNRIADWVVSYLPPGKVLLDLFAGGCGITHCAMLTGKWEKYIVNDRFSLATKLFVECVRGNVPEPRWVSREDFLRDKDTDPYTAVCWSFGNNCRTYLFGSDIEPLKRAIFRAVVDLDFTEADAMGIDLHFIEGKPNWHERRLLVRRYFKEKYIKCNQSLEGLERLNLERLQKKQCLQNLERLELDYSEVPIPDGAVIYCDPPYIGTGNYVGGFDHERFYDWCKQQTAPVIISEYSMPDGFTCIAKQRKGCTFSQKKVTQTIESLFIPSHQIELYKVNKTTLF